jgi:hypothetical protein
MPSSDRPRVRCSMPDTGTSPSTSRWKTAFQRTRAQGSAEVGSCGDQYRFRRHRPDRSRARPARRLNFLEATGVPEGRPQPPPPRLAVHLRPRRVRRPAPSDRAPVSSSRITTLQDRLEDRPLLAVAVEECGDVGGDAGCLFVSRASSQSTAFLWIKVRDGVPTVSLSCGLREQSPYGLRVVTSATKHGVTSRESDCSAELVHQPIDSLSRPCRVVR